MTLDKDNLRALALAATPGPWIVEGCYIKSGDQVIAASANHNCMSFIAAANPAVVLALLDQHAAEIAAKDARIRELEAKYSAKSTALEYLEEWKADAEETIVKCTVAWNSANDRAETAERSLAEANARIRELETALKDVEGLIRQSDGVYGLHMNGDFAPWASLRTGGQFEEWLLDFDAALAGTDTPETTGAQLKPSAVAEPPA